MKLFRAAVILLFVFQLGCVGRTPAALPRNNVNTAPDSQLLRAEKAARDAKESARQARSDTEKLLREIDGLKQQLARLANAERNCSQLATTAEKKLKAQRIAAARKKAAEAQLAVTPPETPAAGAVPEYSKSDAPEGYYKH